MVHGHAASNTSKQRPKWPNGSKVMRGQNSASGVDVGDVAHFLFVANLPVVVVGGPDPISSGWVEGPFL